MKKKIAMLLKTEVRSINPDYSAGTERIFLDDATTCVRHSCLTYAYIAGPVRYTSSFVGKNIRTIWYPHWLTDGIDELIHRSRISLMADILYAVKVVTNILLELYYAVVFVLREHTTDVYYVFDCPLVAFLSPRKTLLAFHNFHPGLSYIFRFKKRMSKTTILFPSKSLMDEYIRQYPDINKKSCIVVYNGIDVFFFKPYPKKPEKITFLFASAWVKEKGAEYIDFVIRELNRKYLHTVNFIIGGSADLWSLSQRRYNEQQHIVSQMQRLGEIYPNVKMAGRVKRHDMPGLYNKSTYLLFPSTWKEPCALMLLESIACGIPVIAFTQGGTKEIIHNNENGFLIPIVSKKYLLETLINVIDTFDRTAYEHMSAKCRQSAIYFSASRRMEIITHLPLFL